MAPNVALRGAESGAADARDKVPTVVRLMREVRRALLANAVDVGQRFPEEARKIHYGEAAPRGIAGTASGEEARALIEEGIEVSDVAAAARRGQLAGGGSRLLRRHSRVTAKLCCAWTAGT